MLFSEKARKRRLRAATGVAYPRGYRVFRRTVWWIAKAFATFKVVGVVNIPAPDGAVRGLDYHPDNYMRNGRHVVDSHAYVIVPNHTYATGSRSDTATKLGPFILACQAGVPIVPVAISGCQKGDKSTRTRLLRRRMIVVKIGQPIMPPVFRVDEVPQDQLEAFRQIWDAVVYGDLLPEADRIRREWHDLEFLWV